MKLMKTEAGQQAFKARSPLFSTKQRTAFIMFDGKKTVEQVVAAAVGLGLTQEDVDHMVAHGFLESTLEQVAQEEAGVEHRVADEAVAPTFKIHSAQDRYKEAKPLATKLTASLGLRGFRLYKAVLSANDFDELLTLLPTIRDAVGVKACEELERTLTE